MSNSSILGATPAPARAKGKDVDALGPSDSSDSGSDVQGEGVMATEADNPGELGALPVDGGNDSDAAGTGERASATGRAARDGADILPDQLAPEALADDDEQRTSDSDEERGA
jgi:hypothetical protein